MISASIKRVDNRPIHEARDEIRAFMVVRNEALRLPSTLRHHRSLGVHRFFILDNGSTDGTLDLLVNEPDVHLFTTNENYSASRCGVDWINGLLDEFGTDHWTLTIDADEHFIYPRYEELSISLFCRFLEITGVEALPCLLLDMYSDRAVADTVHDPSKSLLDSCRYFDPESYKILPLERCPNFIIIGGVRERMFKEVTSEYPPTISKVPLVHWRKGTRFFDSTHSMTPVKTSTMRGALLHFKFLSDFHDRAAMEVIRGEHYEGAREYRVYLDFMRENSKTSFSTSVSACFQSSMQLVGLGLVQTDPVFENFVESI